ncbi:transcriptional regulator, LacI family [Beutenbergia cavernae DSM 12333]|uniref:Transcriptional regulator, LacI family n=1 Tax=Beutenbergia cavernae (strain ATCC BAA-8 / DSM 12333 / CCUG 43141 / JCM 11478 / NBRC 16432 / NCIMB 13614 / HKI 0122) TaxID=471853 RepID=C5BZY9_BEUC1|nr:LacI family DNA-binding transcriptional regulator [Beutenbergia cavernae]ACQ81319.1 transcriptional regulator, LacI family [Beutenbergia cavernae DSM 12333]
MDPLATAPRRPTIRDVATAAGVSRGTVSRVINGGHWVSPTARDAVERAIRSTGYRANQHARSLVTGRSNSLAFLLTEPQHLLFADPTFSILLRGAAEALASRGMTLILLVAGTPEERENVAHYVGARHVDGVLLISSHESDPLLESLQEQGIPLVACGIPMGHARQVPSVSVDEVAGARTMVAHLRRSGRRRIAMITGPLDTPGGRYRLEGYRTELGEDFDERLVAYGDYSAESGAAAISQLLARASDLDAVFAASDVMAAGALAALRRAGRSVPGDVAVGGFDDSGLAATLDPPLTTMHQPFDQISAELVSLLLSVIDGGPQKSVTFPATLVVRESA